MALLLMAAASFGDTQVKHHFIVILDRLFCRSFLGHLAINRVEPVSLFGNILLFASNFGNKTFRSLHCPAFFQASHDNRLFRLINRFLGKSLTILFQLISHYNLVRLAAAFGRISRTAAPSQHKHRNEKDD